MTAASGAASAFKKLVGFKRVSLAPGQSQTLNFTVSVDQLARYDDVVAHDFIVDSGNYGLMAGSSSADIRLSNTFNLNLPPVILPGVPGGLAATLYGTNVLLEWNMASRAVSYAVSRALDPNGPYS